MGLGVMGKEGRAAVRAADFAFARFHHLQQVTYSYVLRKYLDPKTEKIRILYLYVFLSRKSYSVAFYFDSRIMPY